MKNCKYLVDPAWISAKTVLQAYYNSLEPRHTILSSLGIALKYAGYFALIPENLDLKDLANKESLLETPFFVLTNNGKIKTVNRNRKEGQYFDIDRLVYLLGYISRRFANNKDCIETDGYVRLNSTLARTYFKDYQPYLAYLISKGVIEEDRNYVVGEKSKGYRFCSEYWGVATREYFYTNTQEHIQENDRTRLMAIPKEVYDDDSKCWLPNQLVNHLYLSHWYSTKKLSIIKDEATIYAEGVYSEKMQSGIESWDINKSKSRRMIVRKHPYAQYLAAIHSITAISLGEYNAKIDNHVHRLHSMITNMKKELRTFLRYDGQELHSLDISNSQPYLLLTLFNPDFWDENSNTFNIGHLSSNIQELFSPEAREDIKKYVQGVNQDDLQFYRKHVSQGTAYEYLIDAIKAKTRNILSRNEVKVLFLSILYSKEQSPLRHKRLFRMCFPEVYTLICKCKNRNYKDLACLMQNIESCIILHRCCYRIWEEKECQVPVFTIHDSICTTKENINLVRRILEEELEGCVGTKPDIKQE